mgnify:FL=1|jgi:hypothetical protein
MKLASSVKLLTGMFLLSTTISTSAQNEERIAYSQSNTEYSADLVIDFKVKSGSYLTMDEEMNIYLRLKEDKPQAFFFPNPSNGILWIEHNLGSNVTLYIKDRYGKPVFTAHDLKANKLDLKGFKSGSYLLILKGEKGEVTRSISVK